MTASLPSGAPRQRPRRSASGTARSAASANRAARSGSGSALPGDRAHDVPRAPEQHEGREDEAIGHASKGSRPGGSQQSDVFRQLIRIRDQSLAPRAAGSPTMVGVDLDPAHLRSFLAIVRFGGYHRAAEALHLTQPAVSRHMRVREAAA